MVRRKLRGLQRTACIVIAVRKGELKTSERGKRFGVRGVCDSQYWEGLAHRNILGTIIGGGGPQDMGKFHLREKVGEVEGRGGYEKTIVKKAKTKTKYISIYLTTSKKLNQFFSKKEVLK